MKRSTIFLSLLVFSLFVTACGGGSSTGSIVVVPPQSPPQPPPPAGVIGDGSLGELVEWARSTQGLPALGVVIVANGQIAEMAASGRRSLSGSNTVTSNDSWHIGSLTKGLTSSLAGVMVELSVIDWDTTPLDVWPELDASIQPQFRSITVRNLLSHTAGIVRADTVPSKFGDLAAGTIIEKRREFAAELLAQPPVVSVGVESYSNGGYVIIAAMLETLMSTSWEELLTTYVLAPLAMNETGFGAPGTAGSFDEPWGHWDQGTSFDPVSPGADADNPQVLGPAGTVHTTFNDYARFMIAHLDGALGNGSFMTAATFEEIHTPVTGGAGLGWGVRQSQDLPGAIELVHAGSNLRWYSIVRLVPELNAGALFVSNAGGGRALAGIELLENLVVERVDNSNLD